MYLEMPSDAAFTSFLARVSVDPEAVAMEATLLFSKHEWNIARYLTEQAFTAAIAARPWKPPPPPVIHPDRQLEIAIAALGAAA